MFLTGKSDFTTHPLCLDLKAISRLFPIIREIGLNYQVFWNFIKTLGQKLLLTLILDFCFYNIIHQIITLRYLTLKGRRAQR